MGTPMTNVGASLPGYYQRREQPVSTSADIPATAPERHMLVGSRHRMSVSYPCDTSPMQTFA